MPARPAGEFRRTTRERTSQQISWQRDDEAFFASGACHVLAWTCRDQHPDQPVGLAGLRFEGDAAVFHVYATWGAWAFDYSGWSLEAELIAANAAFEGRPVVRHALGSSLAEFCEQQRHRMPHQYWDDPRPRARAYVARFTPPWDDGDAATRRTSTR